jgi:hypothetical protein
MNCLGEEPDSTAGECWHDQDDLSREQGGRGELREPKKTVRRRGPEYQVRVTVSRWGPEYQAQVTVSHPHPGYQVRGNSKTLGSSIRYG